MLMVLEEIDYGNRRIFHGLFKKNRDPKYFIGRDCRHCPVASDFRFQKGTEEKE